MKILFSVYRNFDVLTTIYLQICKSSVETSANEMHVKLLLGMCIMTTVITYIMCDIYEHQ